MLTWTMTINAADLATRIEDAEGRGKPAARTLVGAVLALVAACGGDDLDLGDALAAALAASTAYDALDDLGALDDPDAAGSRDAFRAATVAALERARVTNRTAPRATAAAYRASLNAAALADRFGLAMSAVLEARSDLVAAVANRAEVAAKITEDYFSPDAMRAGRDAQADRLVIEARIDKAVEPIREFDVLVAELREDTARKTETAEDLRRQAMSAYRIAAEAWRALTANSEPRPVESPDR